MLLAVIAIIAGFALLIWSADRFVLGAAALARNLGVPPLVIGLTIVGMGTSAPELLVSALAAWDGNAGLGIGNAIGSNITNIGLVLGVTALIAPLTVNSKLLKRELPLLLAIMLIGYALLADGRLARPEGGALLLGLAALLFWMVWSARRAQPDDALAEEILEDQPPPMSTQAALGWFALGLAVLLGGAKLLVWGAVAVAHALGVSDLVIGLTVVAIGTSLPELATTVLSARRGEPDIALGNVVGSNLFNILGVLGLPGLIAPGPVPHEVLSRDYPLMLFLTALLFLFAFGRQPRRINRAEGGVLLGVFIGYECWLYWTA
ncbi:calcium/sodium antiporter [Acidihalobacter prosperus]|uniref:Calcium/sodium:proton antiporter n=1 Tax=Acidihalobacter prosperus TaxID=160660 RepID=A0A1A6C3G7_9GAMM|nr:calcium/sodium antiporter [Acidihalobacter prosperus]OBS09106.1 calcium/sodium:proton antiporter [Acidihalobacter prosperus]